MFLLETNPILMASWHCFSSCVKVGGSAFKKAHGSEIFKMASKDAELNEIFSNGMNSVTKSTMKAILTGYKDGFNSITSLVDVGGGIGVAMSEIVKAYPHIKGTNFDLPHVVSTAQKYEGVSHVGGDMFQAIPPADVVVVKWIMHDWGDEDCLKIEWTFSLCSDCGLRVLHIWLFIIVSDVSVFFFKPTCNSRRVTKENRGAGVLENVSEGEKYAEHALRKFVRNRSPEIMPSINGFFNDPK
ncbi:(R,S)-reticuline 7-O-methyltransferase-like [Lycium ferocissimum]|uniref:(R,S)-reticuline 7-O-methyltransferase-like n=1 Tax=Lycium ferocissimum TaxID=112874 RepID=UPI0028160766|nr:(R,S)-reticuline 7-O-methyltransferase-like [Lycium ferocissimum]